jgi:hypothetical protein
MKKFTNADLLALATSPKKAVRMKFANSMNAPLKYGRDYASVIRQVFQVDKDDDGNIHYYDKDFYDMVDPKFISATSFTPISPLDADRVMVDTVELPLYLEIPASKARKVRYNVQERMKEVIKSQISLKEDGFLISLLEQAVQSAANTNTPVSVSKANFSAEHLSLAISEVESGDKTKIATNCVLHPKNAHFVRMFNQNSAKGFFAGQKYSDEVMGNGRKSDMFGVAFLYTIKCPMDRLYVTAEPEYTGRIVDVTPPTIVPYDDAKARTFGYVGVQEQGYLLHNVTSVSAVVLTA